MSLAEEAGTSRSSSARSDLIQRIPDLKGHEYSGYAMMTADDVNQCIYFLSLDTPMYNR